MSFRKRNVVLSAPASGQSQTLRQPPTLSGQTASEASVQRRQVQDDTTKQTRSSQNTSRLPDLPDVSRWPLASRPELSPERRAALEPGKKKLQAILEMEKQKRQRNTPIPPLGPGARPSPFDGRPITSTGTASLDPLLAGYGGLLLGHSLLVEEQGTTDFASVMLKAFAAEGLVQGHHVHVLGFGPSWRAELPGIASAAGSSRSRSAKSKGDNPDDKMKIAWRYEALSSRPGPNASPRVAPGAGNPDSPAAAVPFCHAFDLTKRLAAADTKGTLHPCALPNPFTLAPPPQPESRHSPVLRFFSSVRASLESTPPSSIHRVIIPSFLAPSLYALDSWTFPYIYSLILGLRDMLREYGRRLAVIISLSTTLYERNNPFMRMIERLLDNVVELIPLAPGPPSATTAPPSSSSSSSDKSPADKMQGWFKVHKLQVYSELGGNGASPQGKPLRENLCFSVSGSKGMVISPFSLPPVDDDSHKEKQPSSTSKESIEF